MDIGYALSSVARCSWCGARVTHPNDPVSISVWLRDCELYFECDEGAEDAKQISALPMWAVISEGWEMLES